jgi:dTDP-4-dehydrorhamnose reductase
VIGKLSRDEEPDHPALDGAGWWRRPHRVIYSEVASGDVEASNAHRLYRRPARELLITGGTGTLGRAFARICEHRGLSYRLVTRAELDITSRDSVNAALTAYNPWAVINAAGYCRVDDAERDAERCFQANTAGPALLAEACAERCLPFVTFSSDLVFDGNARSPYRESDGVAPLGVYGRSKAFAEKNVLAAHPGALVVRTSAFFGPWDEYNFVTLTLRQLARRCAVRVAEDMTVSPTYIPDLVNTSLDLLIDGAMGLWHLANEGATTWADFARRAASARGYSAALVLPVPAAALGFTALRPAYSALGSERGSGLMPALEIAMERYNVECMATL